MGKRLICRKFRWFSLGNAVRTGHFLDVSQGGFFQLFHNIQVLNVIEARNVDHRRGAKTTIERNEQFDSEKFLSAENSIFRRA